MSENNPPPLPPLTIQQIAGTLKSVIDASQKLLGSNPMLANDVRTIYNNFLKHPITTKILGSNPAPANIPNTTTSTLHEEILEIKKTISALSMAVSKIQPKAKPPPITNNTKQDSNPRPNGKGQGPKTTPTYASQASSPACPSAVLGVGAVEITERLTPTEICKLLNKELARTPSHEQVHISAAKWNSCGNLIITTGHNTTQNQLNTSLTHISFWMKNALHADLADNVPITIRPNVKWSRILINRVPTGATSKNGAYKPAECHSALAAENPAYASLSIMQHPSWVKDPTSYAPESVSSLSFAFEDPDSTLAQALLNQKTLFIFGAQAATKKWKQRTPIKKPAETPPLDPTNPAPSNTEAPTNPLQSGRPTAQTTKPTTPAKAPPKFKEETPGRAGVHRSERSLVVSTLLL
jgi:hypothetical protein